MKAILSWSSGKDSAWSLHVLRHDLGIEVAGLLTTFNETADRVAMHAVRRDLVHAQARAAELPLWHVDLPWPCPNDEYERRMAEMLARLRTDGVTHVAFGDLFLEDVRAYREARLAGTGLTPMFPLWQRPTAPLARDMRAHGLEAVLTCVDPAALDASFAGHAYDEALLGSMPASVDPCGERGEFHTFCWAGPMFRAPIPVAVGERSLRDGFMFADVVGD